MDMRRISVDAVSERAVSLGLIIVVETVSASLRCDSVVDWARGYSLMSCSAY